MKMKVEIRDNSVILDGYINVTQRDSRELPSPRGKFIEQMMPNVFRRALEKAASVDLLFNHKNDRKLGSTSEGNLKLYEDSIGLRGIAKVTDPEIVELAKNQELRGWSFGFVVNQGGDEWRNDGVVQRRYVSDIDLIEVSILSVTPAYIATSIEARGDEEVMKEHRYRGSYSASNHEEDDKEDETFADNEKRDEQENQEKEDISDTVSEYKRSHEELQNYLAVKR